MEKMKGKMMKTGFKGRFYISHWASLVAQMVENLPCNAEDLGLIPGSGWSPEKEMATHSGILAWRIPWTEEPGGLQSTGSQRVRHNWAANTFTFFTFDNFWAANPIRRVESWDIGMKMCVCVLLYMCACSHICLFSIKLLIISQVWAYDTNIIVSVLWNFLKLWSCWTREGSISCCVWRQEHGHFIFIFPLISFLSLLLVFLEPLKTDFETFCKIFKRQIL